MDTLAGTGDEATMVTKLFRCFWFLNLFVLLMTCACVYSPRESALPTRSPTWAEQFNTQPAAPTLTPLTTPTLPPATPTPILTALPTILPTPTPDPAAPFALAMRDAFASDIASQASLPRYALKLWIYPASGFLTGTVQLDLRNTTDGALDDVVLRLYPNFPTDLFGKGGNARMDILQADVAGQAVAVAYEAEDTAVRLPLPQLLLPGKTTALHLTFTATIHPWIDGSWPLPSYYPLLAVREGSDWRLDVTPFADRVFSESALYTAEITVPANLNVIASGTTSAIQQHSDDTQTYLVSTGPMRQFALTVGNFVAAQTAAGDVIVNAYQSPASGFDVQELANVAAAALTVFEQRFGSYPYRELDLQLLPYAFDGGDEYPGLIFVYLDGPVDAGARYVTAHEVAHQWWFGVVGNDIFRQPWLDESFAQYSGIIYAEDSQGPSVAETDWEREVMVRYQGALADGNLPIGYAIDAYPNFNVYYRTVYGKGAFFLRLLRETVGDEAFFRALQTYYQRHRYGVGTTSDIQQAFENASGQDLAPLFQEWVTGYNNPR